MAANTYTLCLTANFGPGLTATKGKENGPFLYYSLQCRIEAESE